MVHHQHSPLEPFPAPPIGADYSSASMVCALWSCQETDELDHPPNSSCTVSPRRRRREFLSRGGEARNRCLRVGGGGGGSLFSSSAIASKMRSSSSKASRLSQSESSGLRAFVSELTYLLQRGLRTLRSSCCSQGTCCSVALGKWQRPGSNI